MRCSVAGTPPGAVGERVSVRGAQDDRPLVNGPNLGPIPYRWVAAGIVCIGIFLGVLDNSITNVALPTLADEFGSREEDVIWVALAFIVVSTGLSLTMGRLGDLYGRKTLYTVGFAIFTVATALSAAAGSLEELIGSRVLQAIGSSMTMANGAAIITASFPPSKRGTGLGIMVSTVGAGFAAGPVLGGILVELLDWRAIFWTRAPFGLIGAFLAWRFLVDAPAEQRPKGLDVPGAFLLFGVLGTLTLGINRGRDLGWDSALILLLFAGCAFCLVALIAVERRSLSPVVDLGLFKQRGFSAGVCAAILQFLGMSAAISLGPFFLIDARGFSTVATGIMIMPMPLAMLLLSPLSGMLSDRVGSRPLTTLGLILVAGALLSMSTLSADAQPIDFMWRMLILGIGTSIFSSPNTSVIMSAVPPNRLGTASAAQTTARTIGNAIGYAIGFALYSGAAVAYGAEHGVARDAPGAILSGYRLALLVAGLAVIPAIGLALIGGQRGVRRAAATVQRLVGVPVLIAAPRPQKAPAVIKEGLLD